MSNHNGKVYQIPMKDLCKDLMFFLHDFYDFSIANEIKRGEISILSEPIKLITCLQNKTANGQGFLDIGCNIGQFSLVAASYGYNVYAFDADKINLEQLNKSAELNNLDLQTFCAIVSDSGEDLPFHFGGPCGNIYGIPFVRYTETVDSERIGSITIDHWWKENGEPEIDIIKMDIEGSEFLALNGMTELLNKRKPHIYCEYCYAYTPYHNNTFAEFIGYFAKYGYKPYLIKRRDTLYEITNRDLFHCKESGNYLFIHKDSDVLKNKLIIPYPVRDILDFADHAVHCNEARFQLGFGMELLNNFKLLQETPLIQRFYDSLGKFQTEQSHMPLTEKEKALVTGMLDKLEALIQGDNI